MTSKLSVPARAEQMLTGPRVVAIGGGHGLAATLRALRTFTSQITAVVSVSDDGGSTGRIREATAGITPGDLRTCLGALSDQDPTSEHSSPLSRAIEHRFSGGDIEGHPLGNLMIAAMAEVEGDIIVALQEMSRLLGVIGTVLPAATEPCVLHGELASGDVVTGQVAVSRSQNIARVFVTPRNPNTPLQVTSAISNAEMVVLGPGSLFTSVLAAAVVPQVRDALVSTSARVVFVVNNVEEVNETIGMDAQAHVDAALAHGLRIDDVIVDPLGLGPLDCDSNVYMTPVQAPTSGAHDTHLLGAALNEIVTNVRA